MLNGILFFVLASSRG